MADFSSDISLGSGFSVATYIPQAKRAADLITIQSEWIEWKTGKAYAVELNVSFDPDWGLTTLRFQRDGAISVYRRSDALIAGGLGRVANYDDFIELGVIPAQLPTASAGRQHRNALIRL